MREWLKRIATAVRREQNRSGTEAIQAATLTTPIAGRAAPAAKPVANRLSGPLLASKAMAATPTVTAFSPPTVAEEELLTRRLKALNLRHFLSEHGRLADHGDGDDLNHQTYLLRLADRELTERDRRKAARLIRMAHFPVVHDIGNFDFAAVPAVDRRLVLELAQCDYIARGENIIALGGNGVSGRTHLLTTLGLAACRRGLPVRYATAAALADELVAAFEERRLLALHRRLDACRLLIVDDLGPAPLSPSGAALLFEVLSRRSERLSTIVASPLPPDGWTRVFSSRRLTDAVVERLSHRAHLFNLGGDRRSWVPQQSDRRAVWREESLGYAAAASAGAGAKRAAAAVEPARFA
jgi:DNA replication protein DnaC